uniref:hypothetical protein n=1 Tax=uncultured Psychrobacter sp. TaxID=259303 RepID=UPI002625DD1D|nr:hypothetical protein [uncultured Psychrobacter sp.]
MTDKSTFVLKLSGIELDNIKAGDIGRLLNDFCKLLGDDHLYFENIYSGSAVLKVKTEPEYYADKLETLNSNLASKALDDIHKVIRRYSQTFTDIDAAIFASRSAVNDEDMDLIHHIEFRKPLSHSFEQSDTFIGKLQRPARGKDDSDHFTILLGNDKTISVSVPKSLSYDLAPYLEPLWRFESLIKFTGTACYEIGQGYTVILKSFNATGFEIVENKVTAKSWITDFVAYGKSGWQDDDDPITTWLEERHS